jgi:hypothetical protein
VRKLIIEIKYSPLIACSPKSTATAVGKFGTVLAGKPTKGRSFGTSRVHDLLETKGKLGALEAGFDRTLVEAAAL